MFDREQMLHLCNEWSKNTLMNTLDIVYTDAGEDFLTATMPVNPRVHHLWAYYTVVLQLL